MSAAVTLVETRAATIRVRQRRARPDRRLLVKQSFETRAG